MDFKLQKALINDVNFRFFGVDQKKLYYSSGKLISAKLIELFGQKQSFTIVCGLGGNASDGISTAIELTKLKLKVNVFIVGRVGYSKNKTFKDLYLELEELKPLYKNLHIKQECYAEDIIQSDVAIECLVGTGLEGSKLNKRFLDCINRVSHFKSKIVAIDIPAPSYTPDVVISLNYPKTDSAITIEIPESRDASIYCGPGEVKQLFASKNKTHKQKNGKVLYVSSTNNVNEFEGIKEAAKSYSCELNVYNFNSELNKINGIKFISDLDFEQIYNEADSIIFGKIDKASIINITFIKHILSINKEKPLVTTWETLEMLNNISDFEHLKKSVLILNRNSIDTALKNYGISERSLSQVIQTNIFFGGFQNTLYSKDGDYKININPKLAKDNSAKVLANICGVLLTKNSAWLSLTSAVFLFEISIKLSEEKNNVIESNLSNAINLCKDF
jgi:NAD(P)H-hydrate repair Nnr-like enzyme with NAD(P)H-hydrate epimerase domain